MQIYKNLIVSLCPCVPFFKIAKIDRKMKYIYDAYIFI